MDNKVLRLKLHQNKAHYRKEESVTNKMTYPLPPFSTIIGAIHQACGYTEYHQMNLSVQGTFGSLAREVYKDLAFLNSTMDDRGMLVKLHNPSIQNEGYKTIAKALKSQGNSFRKGITIEVVDAEELEKYRELKDKNDTFKIEADALKFKEKEEKVQIKKMKDELKLLDKNTSAYESLQSSIRLKEHEGKTMNEEFKARRDLEYSNAIQYYASVTTSIRSYEVLYNVDLVVHIQAEDKVLSDIMTNIYNLTSIGRSEDFVDLVEIKLVTVTDKPEELLRGKEQIQLPIYVNTSALEDRTIRSMATSKSVGGVSTNGTTYYLNKDYEIVEGKRIFNKKRMTYLSDFGLNARKLSEFNATGQEKVYQDEDGYTVCLV